VTKKKMQLHLNTDYDNQKRRLEGKDGRTTRKKKEEEEDVEEEERKEQWEKTIGIARTRLKGP
jgi:hypothetical protein